MAIGNDIIILEVKVKASDAQAELLKVNKELNNLRDELKAAGVQSDEFTKDGRYRALIERSNELHNALKKQNKEYGEIFKDNEKTFMELIKARYKEETASVRELQQLQRHLRAKQSGTREGSDDWKKNIKELAEVENKLEKIKAEMKQVKAEMKLDGSIFKDAETIGKLSLSQLGTAAEALQYKLHQLDPTTEEFIETSKRLILVQDRMKSIENSIKPVIEDTFKLSTVLNNLNAASLNDLKKAASTLDKELGNLDPTTEEFINKTKQFNLVDAQLKKVQNSTKPVKEEFIDIIHVLKNIHSTPLEDLEKASKQLYVSISKLSPASKEFVDATREFKLIEKRIDDIKASTKSLNTEGGSNGIFSQVFGGVTAGTIAADVIQKGFQAIKNTMREAYEATKEYQSALSDLSAITGASGIELEGLKNRADSLTTITLEGGVKITNSASDILTAFKLVGSAKPELLQDAEALQEVTKQTIILSKATGMELSEAVQYATTILNQFEAPASETARYINAIAAGAKEGASEIPDIAASIKEFGAGAKSANISIEESVALVETLGDKMIKGGEAGTQLRNILLVIKAPEALDKKALEALQSHNVNTKKLADTNLTLKERLSELSKIAGDAGAMVRVFGKENITAGEILLKNVDRFDQLNSKIGDTNEAYRQAAVQSDNLANLTETLDNNWKRLSETLGEEADSSLKILMDDLNEVIDDMVRSIDPVKQATEEHKNLSEETINLTQNIKPLLAEYDNLITKGNLSTQEQTRLEKIIQQVALTMPSAITQFDEYGKAIAISTTKAKAFIETQIKLTASAKLNLINALKEENTELSKQIDVRKKSIETGQAEAKWFQLYRKFDADYVRESQNLISESIAKRTENLQRLAELEANSGNDDGRSAMMEREEKAMAALNKTTKENIGTVKEATDKDKKHKDEVILLANSVAFLQDRLSKLNKEFENSPNAKTPEIINKIRLATDKLWEAEDKLEKLRKEAFGRTVEEVKPLDILIVTDWEISGLNEDVKLAKALADEKLNIERQRRDKELADEEKHKQKMHKLLKGGLEAAQIAADAIFQIQAQNSERRKSEELKRIEDVYKKRLDRAKGNQKEQDKINKEMDAKKLQIEKEAFERDKKRSIIQAIINGALAISKTLASYGFTPAGLIASGLQAFSTAAQVAVISNQKFAKGAIVKGASHTEGGIKLYDTKSKSIVGEMEGDEPYLILSKNTYKNNRQLVDALIDTSTNRNGAAVMASGGIVLPNASAARPIQSYVVNSTGPGNNTTISFESMLMELKQIKEAFDRFPRDFKGYIVYQDLKDSQDLVEQVKNKAFGK